MCKKENILSLVNILILSWYTVIIGGIIKDNVWEINVLRVIDHRLPYISNKEYKKILMETQRIVLSKFKIKVKIIDKGEVSIDTYFKKIYNEESINSITIEAPDYYNIWSDTYNYEELIKSCTHYLRRHKLENIKAYFPNSTKNRILSYEDAAKEMLNIYLNRIQKLKKLKLANGELLLRKELYNYNSFMMWKIYVLPFARKNGIDFIFTNECIVVDSLSSPHVNLFTGVINGMFNLISTFQVYSEEDYFRRRMGEIPNKMRYVIVAEYFAHEIGHTLFNLPDVYDKNEEGCVMYSGPETLSGWDRHLSFVKKDSCEREVKKAELMMNLQICKQLLKEKKFSEGEELLKKLFTSYINNGDLLLEIILACSELEMRTLGKNFLIQFVKNVGREYKKTLWDFVTEFYIRGMREENIIVLKKLYELAEDETERKRINELIKKPVAEIKPK